VNIAKLPVLYGDGVALRRSPGGRAMRLGATGKAVTNESRYPYIAELIVADDKLDLEVSRRIMDFHRLRKIQVRHGRRIVTERQIYFRWCFSELGTADAFMEQFGGKLMSGDQPERRKR
jgi:hypothetical protein